MFGDASSDEASLYPQKYVALRHRNRTAGQAACAHSENSTDFAFVLLKKKYTINKKTIDKQHMVKYNLV